MRAARVAPTCRLRAARLDGVQSIRSEYGRKADQLARLNRRTSSPSSTRPSVSTSEERSPAPSRGNLTASICAILCPSQVDTYIFASAGLFPVGKGRAHRDRDLGGWHGVPGQRQYRRARDMDEGDKARHRISGQANEGCSADHAHRDRAAGLDAQSPEDKRADAFYRGLDEIGLARRNPARRQDQIAVWRPLSPALQRSALSSPRMPRSSTAQPRRLPAWQSA